MLAVYEPGPHDWHHGYNELVPIEEGGENAHNTMSLSVAQKYIAASNLAREGEAVALPDNVRDMGGVVSR